MADKPSSTFVVIAICATQVMTMMGLFTFPALLPEFSEIWKLSNTEAGWISGIVLGAYAITVPVLGSYGAEDGGIPAEQVDMLRDTLTSNGVTNDIKLYPGAEHSFFNDTRPAYNEDAAMDSWMKSVEWFEEYLG